MTLKDYIKMADQFKNAYNINREYENMLNNVKPTEVLKAVIQDFSVMLKQDNPLFNLEKWNRYIFG